MNKSGLVGKIILIVVVVVLLVVGVVAVYFYNFHVFKTVRVCVGFANDTGVGCNATQDCFDLAEEYGFDLDSELDGAPDFISENLRRVVDEVVYCDGTCFVKEVRGVNPETQELEMLESCEDDEVEFSVDIRGKEGLEILGWMRSRGSI